MLRRTGLGTITLAEADDAQPQDAPPLAGLWERSVSPFVERFALPLALCFILVGAARIISTYRSLSITTDEPYHFTCGLDSLATGRVCAPENPPLQPLASALLPYLDGARPDPGIDIPWSFREDRGREQMWSLLRRSPDPWRLIVRMRAGVLPFFLAAALAVFFGARHFFGPVEAVLSTALFTLIPAVLAHAGLATTDISATATLGAAFFVFAWWSESPSWKRAAWLGFAGGLAVYSKFSAIPYLAAAVALAAGFHIAVRRPSRPDLFRLTRERAAGLILAGGVAALVLWAGCRFSFGAVEGWPAWIRLPAPELFAAFRALAAHAERGHPGYLLGQFGSDGWWSYYPVALFVKTPLALILAACAGLFDCWQRPSRNRRWTVAFGAGILLVAMASRINIGVRHILPIYVALSLIGGLGLVRLARIWVVLPAALVAWIAISGALAHPDYVAYFNEFASDHPEDVILDSNLEWDQSWVRIGRILRAKGATEVTLAFGHSDFTTEEILERVYGLPKVWSDAPVGAPRPGWHVVDIAQLAVFTARAPKRPLYMTLLGQFALFKGTEYLKMIPGERVGGLVLCYLPPEGQ